MLLELCLLLLCSIAAHDSSVSTIYDRVYVEIPMYNISVGDPSVELQVYKAGLDFSSEPHEIATIASQDVVWCTNLTIPLQPRLDYTASEDYEPFFDPVFFLSSMFQAIRSQGFYPTVTVGLTVVFPDGTMVRGDADYHMRVSSITYVPLNHTLYPEVYKTGQTGPHEMDFGPVPESITVRVAVENSWTKFIEMSKMLSNRTRLERLWCFMNPILQTRHQHVLVGNGTLHGYASFIQAVMQSERASEDVAAEDWLRWAKIRSYQDTFAYPIQTYEMLRGERAPSKAPAVGEDIQLTSLSVVPGYVTFVQNYSNEAAVPGEELDLLSDVAPLPANFTYNDSRILYSTNILFESTLQVPDSDAPSRELSNEAQLLVQVFAHAMVMSIGPSSPYNMIDRIIMQIGTVVWIMYEKPGMGISFYPSRAYRTMKGILYSGVRRDSVTFETSCEQCLNAMNAVVDPPDDYFQMIGQNLLRHDTDTRVTSLSFGSNQVYALYTLNSGDAQVWNDYLLFIDFGREEELQYFTVQMVVVFPDAIETSSASNKDNDSQQGNQTLIIWGAICGAIVVLCIAGVFAYGYLRSSRLRDEKNLAEHIDCNATTTYLPSTLGTSTNLPSVFYSHNDYVDNYRNREEYIRAKEYLNLVPYTNEYLKSGMQSDREESYYERTEYEFGGSLDFMKTSSSEFWIDASEIMVDSHLGVQGSGNFGKILVGEYRGCEIALKVIPAESESQYFEEGDLLTMVCHHPRICRLYGICRMNDMYYMIIDYYKDGSILDVFRRNIKLSDDNKCRMCKQICDALVHLKKEEVIHGDIAARNCLIDVERMNVVVSDFGLSKRHPSKHPVDNFAPRWASPELIKSRLITFESDVWAVGCTFAEIFSEQKPFLGRSKEEVLIMVSVDYSHPEIDEGWPGVVRDTLGKIFVPESRRIDIETLSQTLKQSTRALAADSSNFLPLTPTTNDPHSFDFHATLSSGKSESTLSPRATPR